MMHVKTWLKFALLVGLCSGCPRVFPEKAASCEHRVLFVGNSFTYANDLPTLVSTLGATLGCTLSVSQAAEGGASFARHVERAHTWGLIREGSWDAVVFQNQSQIPALGREYLEHASLPHLKRMVAEVRAGSPRAAILLFETWGRRDGDEANCENLPHLCTFEGHAQALSSGIQFYADAVGGRVVRAGQAWHQAVTDPARPFAKDLLWDEDGSHPGRHGTTLTALLFVKTITGKSLGPTLPAAGLPALDAAYLRRLADGF